MNRLSGAARALLPPVIAAVISLAVACVVLLISGNNPGRAYLAMWRNIASVDGMVTITNFAVRFYVSGLAVAIGFKMNLFNIGVDGQYRLAAVLAAAFGAWAVLPPVLHTIAILVVAIAVGAGYAAIPAVLKVTKNVNEVVSTIMLNSISVGVTAFLVGEYFDFAKTDNLAQTETLRSSARIANITWLLPLVGLKRPKDNPLEGFLPIAILLGVGAWLLIYKTRFGFDLRASGMNAAAARSSGVDPKRMVVRTMMLSGAVAGLIGMAPLLCEQFAYGDTFPQGLGFAGIGIALLGRNHPAGIAFAAFVWAAIEQGSRALSGVNVPESIGLILQGTLLLVAVIVYEVFRRRNQQRTIAATASRAVAQVAGATA